MYEYIYFSYLWSEPDVPLFSIYDVNNYVIIIMKFVCHGEHMAISYLIYLIYLIYLKKQHLMSDPQA